MAMKNSIIRFFVFLLVLTTAQIAYAQPDQETTPAATSLSFERAGYWLVNPAPADIALHSDAKDKLHLALYRLTDPELLTKVMTARAARSLGEAELLRRVADGSRPIWQGDVLPDSMVMQVPLDILAGENGLPLGNGVYVLTATLNDAHATQWFMRTSTDLATRFYGRHALVTLYDMTTRQPRANVPLVWLDASGKKLSEPVATDANGTAWLDRPQSVNGVGAPVLLMAGNQGQDIAFASVPTSGVSTIDRALILPDSGQVMPTVSSLFVAPGYALTDLQAKLAGKEIELTQVAGAVFKATGAVPAEARGGSVALELFHDDQLLARHMLTQGINPDFTIDWQQKPASVIGTAKQIFKFRLLQNGKPLASRAGQLVVSAITGADLDDAPVPNATPLSLDFTTDRNGAATVTLDPAKLGWLTETAPSYAALAVTLADAPVGERVLLSLYPARNWLEITPGFANNAVAEGATARFTARLGSPDAKSREHASTLDWQLARETYKFEWYQADDGRWTYRTKTALTQVANGKALFNAKDNAAAINVPVGAGRYRLTVTDAANRLTASMGFTAGWWLAPVPTSTPERIELKAQMEQAADGKPRMAVFVDPPFAGRVWLAATTSVGTRTVMADVPDEGAFVYIDQADLPAGQPLTLNAFALPTKQGSTLVQALGSLTLPVGLPVRITPATVSARQPTGLTIDGLMASTKAILQLLDDEKNVIYATSLLDVTGGSLHVIVPPLAIADGAVVARIIATDENRVSTVTDKRLTVEGDITLDAPSVAGDTLSVTIRASKNVTDKMRLSLIGAEAASVAVPPLKTGKPVTVKLPTAAIKAGQKDMLLRLESHDGTTLAARPLRLLVK